MPKIATETANTVEYWDGLYRDGLYPTLDANNTARYLAAARFQKGDSALDVGCGQGGLGKMLLAHYPDVRYTGWDYSLEGLCKHVLPPEDKRWTLRAGTWQEMAEAEAPHDSVYLCEILEHVDDPAAMLAAVAPLAAQRLVLTVPYYGALTWEQHHGEHAWDFSFSELRVLLRPYGSLVAPIPAGVHCIALAVNTGGNE